MIGGESGGDGLEPSPLPHIPNGKMSVPLWDSLVV